MTVSEPVAGQQGDSLPSGEIILRLAKPSKDGNVSPIAFELSSADEAAPLKSLSVWAETLTKPEQARNFLSPEYSMVLRLSVDGVRKLRPIPDFALVTALDVVWDPLVSSESAEPVLPGAAGHAGIIGLLRSPAIPRIYYKSFRSQLADLATERGIVLLP